MKKLALFLPLLLLAGCREGAAVARLPESAPTTPVLEPQDAAKLKAAPGPDGAFSGQLEARRRSTLSPRVGGVVEKVLVRDGDTVDAHAALVLLDPEDFALRVRAAAAGYDAAKAGFATAEANWKRAKSLLADTAMPQAQFEMADAQYQGAKAQLAQAEVGLAMARKAERDATVRAPFAGVIVRRSISEGEYATVMPPTQLLTIEETGSLDLRVYLPADRAATIARGDAVTVKIPALDRELKGKVIQVLPPMDPKDGTVALLIEIDDPSNALRPGMTAEARVAGKLLEKKP